MSSSEARERWRIKRTNIVIEYCQINNLTLETLNKGYQFRIQNALDVYPTNGRYHILSTNERGDWDTIDDLDELVQDAVEAMGPVHLPVPSPYQREMLDKINGTQFDFGDEEETIASKLLFDSKPPVAKYLGIGADTIIIDEAGHWPHYNWYRHPIKWWRLRKLMKTINNVPEHDTYRLSKPKENNDRLAFDTYRLEQLVDKKTRDRWKEDARLFEKPNLIRRLMIKLSRKEKL
jgi:hypothetical protein